MNILFPLLMRLAQIQSEPVDRLALQAAIEQIDKQEQTGESSSPRQFIEQVLQSLHRKRTVLGMGS